MDRISQLPECIVHRILSCFDSLSDPPVDLVRMSVLSKKWFHLTASFPFLDFSIHTFRDRENFFKYLQYTMCRFCLQDVAAHSFKLSATLQEPAELDIFNVFLELVLEKGLSVLEINFTKSLPKYRLPNILLSVSVLKSLTLTGCELPSSLMVDDVKFKSLTRLRLENVPINDNAIEYLTASCPLLQDFHISRCHGFQRFCVYGHHNLQKVWFYYNTRVERIDIEAPNLSDLTVVDMNQRGAPRMNLASCKKLTTVTYFGHPLPNSNGFTNFLSNFPFIENLCLDTKYKFNNLKLSSHSLRTLMLHANCDLEEIEFDTLNLVLFIYSCKSGLVLPLLMNLWPVAKHSTHLKACMQCYPDGYIDTLWFLKLRQFLEKKNGFNVLNLYIDTVNCQKFTELEKLKAIELPPYELEHVELQLDNKKSLAFVEAVLWCCRPRSLTLRSSFPFFGFEDVVKFTSEKLLQQEDEGHTDIQIVSPSSSKAQKNFMDLKSLSMALPLKGKTISFIKEEGALFLSANSVDTLFT